VKASTIEVRLVIGHGSILMLIPQLLRRARTKPFRGEKYLAALGLFKRKAGLPIDDA
jgi:hypothetical protein